MKYAYALLHIAEKNGSRKKKVFVAYFNEGNIKSRIRNRLKNQRFFIDEFIRLANIVLVGSKFAG